MSNRVTQVGAEIIATDTGGANRVTQVGAEIIAQNTGGANRVTQVGLEVVATNTGGEARVGAVNIEVMYRYTSMYGPLTATATVAGALNTAIPLDGALTCSGSVAADLATAITLSGVVLGTANVDADFTGGTPPLVPTVLTATATAVASKFGPEFLRLTADSYLRQDAFKQITADAELTFASTTVQVSTVGLDVLYIVHPPVRVTWVAVSAFASDTATKARISDLKVNVLGRMATISVQLSDMKVYVLGRRASGEARVTQVQQSILAPVPHEDTYVIWWY